MIISNKFITYKTVTVEVHLHKLHVLYSPDPAFYLPLLEVRIRIQHHKIILRSYPATELGAS